uniref:Uncharacterized protein n=1 Tax=Nannocystis exedens TaxID=54 RepID=A0A3S5GYQ1_9BACT|nr:hypothetical protein [Nannocystis exedens]
MTTEERPWLRSCDRSQGFGLLALLALLAALVAALFLAILLVIAALLLALVAALLLALVAALLLAVLAVGLALFLLTVLVVVRHDVILLTCVLDREIPTEPRSPSPMAENARASKRGRGAESSQCGGDSWLTLTTLLPYKDGT